MLRIVGDLPSMHMLLNNATHKIVKIVTAAALVQKTVFSKAFKELPFVLINVTNSQHGAHSRCLSEKCKK